MAVALRREHEGHMLPIHGFVARGNEGVRAAFATVLYQSLR